MSLPFHFKVDDKEGKDEKNDMGSEHHSEGEAGPVVQSSDTPVTDTTTAQNSW